MCKCIVFDKKVLREVLCISHIPLGTVIGRICVTSCHEQLQPFEHLLCGFFLYFCESNALTN